MAILKNIFKKGEEAKESSQKKEEKKPKAISKKTENKTAGLAWSVLISPHVTEKAASFEEENKYVFRVSKETNKIEIRKAVQDLYKVDVEDVKVVNIHPKKRRVGKKGEGVRKGYKKAIVRIKKGQKIEILPR